MSKRKSSSDAVLPRKKAKLAHQSDPLHFEAGDALTVPSPPSSQTTTTTRREKRKRTDYSDTDCHNEPRAKRARTTQSPSDTTSCSRSTSPEPWPSIGFMPEEEKEPSSLVEEFYRSCIETEVECSCESQTIYRNPLPSPVPSERGTSEDEAADETTNYATQQIPHSASKSQELPSPNPQWASSPSLSSSREKNRRSPRRTERRSLAPSYQRQPRPQRRRTRADNHDQPRNEKSSQAVENFLHTKRSSRRDSKCELWYLGDNGTPCAVVGMRR
ncbi:hypothetical protein V8C35DRAFT_310279 [Trichoderma chlorosporum]